MDPNTDQSKPGRIGLALTGGGVRGVAHLGVIQAFADHGIKFSHISGTSAGAIAAAFHGAGYSAQDFLTIIKDSKLLRLLRPGISGPGLLSILHARNLIQQYIPHNSFAGLKTQVTISAVNLGQGKLVYFTAGQLDVAVLASCCLPGIFKPIVIDGHMYVDGGLLNNFPVEPLVGNCDFIVGSCCNHLPVVTRITSTAQLIERAALIAINANLNTHKLLCDVYVEPHGLGGYGLFDIQHADEIYLIGYEEGLKALDSHETLRKIVKEFKKGII